MHHASLLLLPLALLLLLIKDGHALPHKGLQISALTCSKADKHGGKSSTAPFSLVKSFAVQNAAKSRAGDATMQNIIERVVYKAENKVAHSLRSLKPLQYPTATEADGHWEVVKPGHWMAGFFPGVMWQLHDLTGKQEWAEAAQLWQEGLANRQRDWSTQHDFGNRSHLQQALAAAEALAWAYNPATKSLRTFEGWKPAGATDLFQQLVIIDFMVNIQLLVWGALHVGSPGHCTSLHMDSDPAAAWLEIAHNHARQVAAHHMRPDGTTYHIVEYNPVTAEVNKKFTYQGYGDNSTWARGQSWAMLGFSMLIGEAGGTEFLEPARKTTDAWLQLLDRQWRQRQLTSNTTGVPEKLDHTAGTSTAGSSTMHSKPRGEAAGTDGFDRFIPLWDFDAPFHAELDGPRDTSAAAVAALGMLYLAEAETSSTCSERYLYAAVNTLQALAGDKNLAVAEDTSFPALLKHATGGFPMQNHVDVGLISGDYYFLAALNKCLGMDTCRSYPV